MGPFSIIPFMECNHGVLSLHHKLSGELKINDNNINFNDGTGYIEKDWGCSFPKTYQWIQCNDFKENKCSIMVSIADIPFMGINFKGCIAVVYYKGKEYRLATYNGVKILKYNSSGLIIQRGKYRLEIEIFQGLAQKLLAPNIGHMTRPIYENASCKGRFKFYIKNKIEFDFYSENTSFEYVD
ncbi:hypothetical protein JCM1393_08840 [Clostridium carnis]